MSIWRRRQWHPTPVLLPGESHGWKSLVGCSPCGREESDTTERLPFHFSLSCIGEGNGNPFQCSCLENPRGGGAWRATVYGVTQSQTRLKRLSSSSNISLCVYHNFFIQSSVDRHLGCFHVLAIVNSAGAIGVHVSFSIMVSPGYMPSSGVVGSYGSYISSFVRNLHTFLQFAKPSKIEQGRNRKYEQTNHNHRN